jgi:hypothetical protein
VSRNQKKKQEILSGENELGGEKKEKNKTKHPEKKKP